MCVLRLTQLTLNRLGGTRISSEAWICYGLG